MIKGPQWRHSRDLELGLFWLLEQGTVLDMGLLFNEI